MAELWNASMAANRLTSSNTIMTSVMAEPRYVCARLKIRSPVGRCSSAVFCAWATPVALTTAQVVTPRIAAMLVMAI